VTKGIDFLGDFKLGALLDGEIGAGISATHVSEYSVAPISVEGIQVQGGFEASGFLNYQTTVYPIPKWKGAVHLEYDSAMHFLRFTLNYVEDYTDQRTAPFAANAYRDSTGAFVTVPQGKIIEEWITFDMTYQLRLMEDMTLAFAIDNIFDEDPPFARLDLNYDPLTHTTLGRTFKFGVRKEF
jgi:iron complex outermembrane receptor protein